VPSESYANAGSASERRRRYGQLKTALWSERSSFDADWRELGDWLLPRRTRFWTGDRNRGGRRNQNIIDATARLSARTLQSGMHAGMTSPARPWMKLTTPDPDLAKFPPVKQWLHEVTERMLTTFQQCNLYNVLPIIYGDMGVFGTGCMSILPDTKDLLRCYPQPLGSYALGLDERGLATTFIREYEMTVRQIVRQFAADPVRKSIDWSNISLPVKAAWDRGDYETPFKVCWVVMPNEDARADRLEAKYLPWTSCWFELGSQEPNKYFLRESGYKTFPIVAPRWDITAEDTYGTDCPGMTAIGDVKGLQIMTRRKAQAVHKMVDPPLVGPTALQTQKTSLLPGDITYIDVRESMQGLRSIHEVTLNIQHLREDIREQQYRIQRCFYEDLFLMLQQSDDARGAQPMTAREVSERHEEKLIALGPMLERTTDECHEPLVDRVFLMMQDAHMIPDPPEAVQGVKLDVEYTSILAQAQKLVGLTGLDRFVMSVGPLVQADPSLRHKIVWSQVIDNYSDMTGVDPRIVRPTEEADQMAAQEAQQQQAAMQAEQAAKMATAVKAAGTTPMGTDSALDRMLSGVGAAALQPAPAGVQ